MDDKKKLGSTKGKKGKRDGGVDERDGGMELEEMAKKSVEISASLTDLKMRQQIMQLVVVAIVVCCTLLLLVVTCLHTMHLVVVICLRCCCCCCTSCLPVKAVSNGDSATEKVRERKRERGETTETARRGHDIFLHLCCSS